MRLESDRGFTLLELVLVLGLAALVGAGAISLLQKTKRETDLETASIQDQILSLGAEKFIQKDLAQAGPGLNYLSVLDDDGKWFYAFKRDFECEQEGCGRQLTLKLGPGELESANKFYLLAVEGKAEEKLSFAIDPERVFDSSGSYVGINGLANQPGLDIAKSALPFSPWEAGRLLVLSSNVSMLDCAAGLSGGGSPCASTCKKGPGCNAPVERRFKMLGAVSSDEKDLDFAEVYGLDKVLKTRYKPCRRKRDGGCSRMYNKDIVSSKLFYESLPYIPGRDNGTYFQPVTLIRYYLARKSPGDPAKETALVRESATFRGGSLRFNKGHKLLIGVQSVVFTRNNVSSPMMSFKINRPNRYNR